MRVCTAQSSARWTGTTDVDLSKKYIQTKYDGSLKHTSLERTCLAIAWYAIDGVHGHVLQESGLPSAVAANEACATQAEGSSGKWRDGEVRCQCTSHKGTA